MHLTRGGRTATVPTCCVQRPEVHNACSLLRLCKHWAGPPDPPRASRGYRLCPGHPFTVARHHPEGLCLVVDVPASRSGLSRTLATTQGGRTCPPCANCSAGRQINRASWLTTCPIRAVQDVDNFAATSVRPHCIGSQNGAGVFITKCSPIRISIYPRLCWIWTAWTRQDLRQPPSRVSKTAHQLTKQEPLRSQCRSPVLTIEKFLCRWG